VFGCAVEDRPKTLTLALASAARLTPRWNAAPGSTLMAQRQCLQPPAVQCGEGMTPLSYCDSASSSSSFDAAASVKPRLVGLGMTE
jgi:hypothetical protein